MRNPLGRAGARIADDLRTDPYLAYLLLAVTVLAGFWFWHLVPNFATVDERWRLLDPIRAVRAVVADPGFDALRRGVLASRLAGATFYFYGIATLPVIVAVLSPFTPGGLAGNVPQWVFTWSQLFGRAAIVVTAVGCVYLTYRIGTTMRDRRTGRLAGLLLSLTWGFLAMAHEIGEDLPATFCVLFVLYLALRYVETGDDRHFLAGCLVGGFAIAFKLTAATGAIALAAAYLLRARRSTTGWRDALVRPRLVVLGVVLGVAGLVVGFPEVLVAGPDVITGLLRHHASTGRTSLNGPIAPSWWWLLRGYLNGFGLPLFVAVLGGLAASVGWLRDRSNAADGTVLLLVALATYLIAYVRWEYVRLHHLLPTFPLAVLILAVALSRLRAHNPPIARPLLAVLLVTTGVYAGVGDLGYASEPRDEALDWIDANADDDATMDIYRPRPRDAAIPSGVRTYDYRSAIAQTGPDETRPTQTEWMRNMPRRCPDYIQLTYWDLVYLGTGSPGETKPSKRAARGATPPWMPSISPAPKRTAYIRALLAGEYPYTVVAEFGPRPSLWPQPRTETGLVDLLRGGVYPWSITYGDDQDFRDEQYTLILQRTGNCNASTSSLTAG